MAWFRFVVWFGLAATILSHPVAARADQPNVLLICVDDLRPELASFGKDYIQSPNIDSLAARGRAFHRHYVQAPTCGASRYALLTGQYGPTSNEAIFARAKRIEDASPSMPRWFRQNGYTTVSVGKVSHHPGGRGGPDWDDDDIHEMPGDWDRHLLPAGPWQHPRGAMHGLANGEIRSKPSNMDVLQTVQGDDSIYPDGLIVKEAISQLNKLAGQNDPFFLAVGLIKPHLPFGAPAKYLKPYADVTLPAIPHPRKPEGRSTWHGSGEFMRYNRWGRDPNQDAEFATMVRKHYAACVSYADASVGRVLQHLDKLNLRDDTIVVLWGDHGWHLGEHAVWGKHTLFEESLRSPLIIDHAGMSDPGISSDSVVETVDVFPTLCGLAKLPKPDFTHGVSLEPILDSPASPGRPAYSYWRKGAGTIRSETHRLVAHADGSVELYDFTGTEEAKATDGANVAREHPEIVRELSKQLESRAAIRNR